MMQELAYAKINIFLDVLSKRADGYHNIGTLFQTIGACDVLQAEDDPSGKIHLSYSQAQDYPMESDLVYRAAELLRAHCGVKSGVRMHLEKRLPLGAGLGGGSADCAAALRLLNRMWTLGLSPTDLEDIGGRLGADVPFLVQGGSVLATGIGEKLQVLPDIPLLDGVQLVVVTPHCAVPTKVAYGGISPSGDERWDAFAKPLRSLQTPPICLELGFFNKFEESVLPQYPQIGDVKAKFQEMGALATLMSGSGASVFALVESKEKAKICLEKLKPWVRWSWSGNFISRDAI